MELFSASEFSAVNNLFSAAGCFFLGGQQPRPSELGLEEGKRLRLAVANICARARQKMKRLSRKPIQGARKHDVDQDLEGSCRSAKMLGCFSQVWFILSNPDSVLMAPLNPSGLS